MDFVACLWSLGSEPKTYAELGQCALVLEAQEVEAGHTVCAEDGGDGACCRTKNEADGGPTGLNEETQAPLQRKPSENKKLAYKEMPYFTYLLSTLLLYGSQIVLSLILDDIGVIFEFISAVAISSLAFTFPGVFYLMAERKFASTFHKESNRLVHYQAVAMAILGLFVFTFFMTANILEIVYAEEGHGGDNGEREARPDPNTIIDD